MLADTPKPILLGRVWLAGGDNRLLDRIGHMKVPVFPLRGRDLIAAGLEPGERMGEFLQELRRWWLEHGCPGGAECRAELHRLLGEPQKVRSRRRQPG
jgi:hypothetical protein